MVPTLVHALERIAKLESRIAQLEKVFLGHYNSNPTPPVSPQPSQPVSSSKTDFPQLDAELTEKNAQKKARETSTKTSRPTFILATSALEANYPNIASNITLIWGSPECEAYLNKLMLNSRGERQGFNLDIMNELMLLTAITENEKMDIWTKAVQIGDRC